MAIDGHLTSWGDVINSASDIFQDGVVSFQTIALRKHKHLKDSEFAVRDVIIYWSTVVLQEPIFWTVIRRKVQLRYTSCDIIRSYI